jgi:hypothetical protein
MRSIEALSKRLPEVFEVFTGIRPEASKDREDRKRIDAIVATVEMKLREDLQNAGFTVKRNDIVSGISHDTKTRSDQYVVLGNGENQIVVRMTDSSVSYNTDSTDCQLLEVVSSGKRGAIQKNNRETFSKKSIKRSHDESYYFTSVANNGQKPHDDRQMSGRQTLAFCAEILGSTVDTEATQRSFDEKSARCMENPNNGYKEISWNSPYASQTPTSPAPELA